MLMSFVFDSELAYLHVLDECSNTYGVFCTSGSSFAKNFVLFWVFGICKHDKYFSKTMTGYL